MVTGNGMDRDAVFDFRLEDLEREVGNQPSPGLPWPRLAMLRKCGCQLRGVLDFSAKASAQTLADGFVVSSLG